jgi:large subunit ribosomal protein L17
MRHLKHRTQLGRTKEHRAALLANLSAALLDKGRITTTLAKAKALRPYVERVITLAVHANGVEAKNSMHLRRQAVAKVRSKDAVTKLFKERVSEFKDRKGGYTRIYKLIQRNSDGAAMAIIELIPASDTGYAKKGKAAPAAQAAPAPAEPAAPAAETAAPKA